MSQIPFSFIKPSGPPPVWPTGADGALVLNGTSLQLLAGSIKDYSSISIINGGLLEIIYDLPGGNGGDNLTILGCVGTCVINTGGKIEGRNNALAADASVTGVSYPGSRNLPPGAAISSVSYSSYLGRGGTGGGNTANGTDVLFPGGDASLWGHGSGGAGQSAGGDTTNVDGWGVAGQGTEDSFYHNFAYGASAFTNGFSIAGGRGEESDSGGLDAEAGGASGATRGLCGNHLYLQIVGAATIDDGAIDLSGRNGADGGNPGGNGNWGGPGTFMAGGGGGGGSCGGSGGKCVIRNKIGTITSAKVNVAKGLGGLGGLGGSGFDVDGNIITSEDGGNGEDGLDGVIDIANY